MCTRGGHHFHLAFAKTNIKDFRKKAWENILLILRLYIENVTGSLDMKLVYVPCNRSTPAYGINLHLNKVQKFVLCG